MPDDTEAAALHA
jgi:hypothetical protein